jgi:hypothetical protein
MVPRVRLPLAAGRLTAALAALAMLAGCGSAARSSDAQTSTGSPQPTAACAQAVMRTLGSVLGRIYHEGIESERTGSAEHLIEYSAPLKAAIESRNSSATLTAAHSLLGTGHLTDLHVIAGGRTLVNLGGPALAPLKGVIKGAAGEPIATYTTSVWSDSGFASEAAGVAEGLIAVRQSGRSLGHTLALGPAPLSGEGTVTIRGVAYEYYSLAATTYPAGAAARIYLLRPVGSLSGLCGSDTEQTTVKTLIKIAQLIYAGEIGPRSQEQIRRLQHNQPLLLAAAAHDPVATRTAIIGVLNHHVVRVRVLDTGGKLISDVGGPYVLGPVSGPLRLHGRHIGTLILSIQDDEGYLRLARRLAGLKVLMYMGPPGHMLLVKDSLGPSPGTAPAAGPFTYHGEHFQVYTLAVKAFPSGPLTIRVLIPIPYL